jgi:hypothetical protein
MEVAVFILRTGERLVAQGEQLETEPRCHLQEPYEVSGKTTLTLTPWLKGLTNEQHFLLHSESLLTVCDVTDELKASYAKKVGKKVEDFQPKEQEEEKILLNEDEQMPSAGYDDDHGYEPSYQET